MSDELPRIYFDTNEGHHDSGYWLWLDRSVTDLRGLEPGLREGIEVVIYMPGELEMRALLRFDRSEGLPCPEGIWVADPIPGTITYLD
jgi:hypothetical protein